VWIYGLGGAVGLALLWYALAMAWASSVSKHQPQLHESVQRRYGWRCARCGRVSAPSCRVGNCGGPLVWVQRETRIKCARCHRYFIAHPMLFRQRPRARRMWCRQCKSVVLVKDWKIG
jgi:DNA-directed RNA polymerase subunit RPC12/RpoP